MAVRLTKFKIGLYVFFVICAVGSVAALRFGGAGNGGSGSDKTVLPTITIWGNLDGNSMGFINRTNGNPVRVNYQQVRTDTVYNQFLEAVATNQTPDLIMMPFSALGQFFKTGKHFSIPYTSYTERAYDDAFISGASFLKTNDGIMALPLFADPLVTFYNRAMLDNAGVLAPMSSWADAYTVSSDLTQRSGQLGITRSAFGLGEASNITHAKTILSALFLQLGLQVMPANGGDSDLRTRTSSGTIGASALRFYTSFADPSKNFYTWNRSMPTDKNAFLNETLVYYFGPASERQELQSKNPNMSLDVALFPQAAGGQPITTGDLYVALFPKAARNIPAAISYAYWLTSPGTVEGLIEAGSYPYTPVLRTVLAKPGTDRFTPIEYRSAVISKFWYDLGGMSSNDIFADMISDVTTGRRSVEDSVERAVDRLNAVQ